MTSFFTSFGYFETEDDDLQVLREVARVLEGGGRFVLDFLNADHVRANLVPRSHDIRDDGVEILQERSISPDGRRVVKHILCRRPGEEDHRSRESVRLYEPEDLESLHRAAGLEVDQVFGDLAGGALETDSTRVVMTSSKS